MKTIPILLAALAAIVVAHGQGRLDRLDQSTYEIWGPNAYAINAQQSLVQTFSPGTRSTDDGGFLSSVEVVLARPGAPTAGFITFTLHELILGASEENTRMGNAVFTAQIPFTSITPSFEAIRVPIPPGRIPLIYQHPYGIALSYNAADGGAVNWAAADLDRYAGHPSFMNFHDGNGWRLNEDLDFGFSTYYVVPEPTPLALAAVGLAMVLAFKGSPRG